MSETRRLSPLHALLELPMSRAALAFAGVGLVLAVLAVYGPALSFPFVYLDDAAYVAAEPMVHLGFRGAALEWTFTHPHGSNFHPVTTLAHIALCHLFGVAPGAHHAANIFLHAANALLVFALLRRLTGADWASLLVAAWFALHPLRVESVAWISELKDVLCAAFWLLALGSYAAWVKARISPRLAVLVALAALAIFSKPMAVTLPFTLLVLDLWPLRRWPGEPLPRLIVEKWPLWLLAIVQGAITLLVQADRGATEFGARIPFFERAANALVSVARYAAKTLAPSELAAFYPFPHQPSWIAAGCALAAGSAFTWLIWRKAPPFVRAGWLWFLGTLLPVAGLVQVGRQAWADRYSYVPTLGLLWIAAWSLRAAALRWPAWRWPIVAGASVSVACCGWASRQQVGYWRSSDALFARLVAVAGEKALALDTQADNFVSAGRMSEAAALYRRAFELRPDLFETRAKRAYALGQAGHLAESEAELGAVLRGPPRDAHTWSVVAFTLQALGCWEQSIPALEQSLRLAPRQANTARNLALALAKLGHNLEAERELRAALALDRWMAPAWNELAVLAARRGAREEALALLEKSLWIDPSQPATHRNLAALLDGLGRPTEAEEQRRIAARWEEKRRQ